MTAQDQAFDADRYWIDRHERLRGDPRAVGHAGHTVEQNLLGVTILRSALAHALQDAGPFRRVLEIGCGTGRVAPVFADAGIDYAGIDVSPVAVEAARAQMPGATFVTGSALAVDWGPPRDLVAVIYVFVHVVGDGEWRRLIGRIAEFLAPGGALLFADEMPVVQDRPAPHVVRRPLAAYRAALAAEGMDIDDHFTRRLAVGPAFGMADRLFLARKPAGAASAPSAGAATLTPDGRSGMADGFRTGGP